MVTSNEKNSLFENSSSLFQRFDFDTARSFLGGSSRHLGTVLSSGKGDRRVMCYVISAIVIGFVFLYYVVSSFRSA